MTSTSDMRGESTNLWEFQTIDTHIYIYIKTDVDHYWSELSLKARDILTVKLTIKITAQLTVKLTLKLTVKIEN